jgi:hypothetical protein
MLSLAVQGNCRSIQALAVAPFTALGFGNVAFGSDSEVTHVLRNGGKQAASGHCWGGNSRSVVSNTIATQHLNQTLLGCRQQLGRCRRVSRPRISASTFRRGVFGSLVIVVRALPKLMPPNRSRTNRL